MATSHSNHKVLMSRFYIAMSSIDGIFISSMASMVFYRLDTFHTIYLWIYKIYWLLLHYFFSHVFLIMAIYYQGKDFMVFCPMDTIHFVSWIWLPFLSNIWVMDMIHCNLLTRTTDLEKQVAGLTENVSRMSEMISSTNSCANRLLVVEGRFLQGQVATVSFHPSRLLPPQMA